MPTHDADQPTPETQTSPASLPGTNTDPEPVYRALATHQRSEEWSHRDLIAELQTWAERFDAEFKLQCGPLSLAVCKLSRRHFGHFRCGHNGFGLWGEIAINSIYVDQRPRWQTLGTLLHELIHAWQQANGDRGKNGTHNRQFRDKARSLGLLIDTRGVTEYAPESPFTRILEQHGIAISTRLATPAKRRQGHSKLRKWRCDCTNVRVGVLDFYAQCLKCGQVFTRCDPPESPSQETD